MFSSVIFDMDGVIVDSETVVDVANTAFLKAHGCDYQRGIYKSRAMGKTLVEGVMIMQELFGLVGPLSKLAEERRDIIARFYREKIEFMLGFVPFYKRVVQMGFKYAVATSADPYLLEIVQQRLGLDRMFPGRIFTVASVGNLSKPDPALYLYAASQLGVVPADCLVIEDSPLGVEAAKRAGTNCVAITTTLGREHLSSADRIVNSFSEIDLNALISV